MDVILLILMSSLRERQKALCVYKVRQRDTTAGERPGRSIQEILRAKQGPQLLAQGCLRPEKTHPHPQVIPSTGLPLTTQS